MHDIHKDSLIYKKKAKTTKKSDHLHSHDNDPNVNKHPHDHSTPHGHKHDHDDSAYEEHDHDIHTHTHDHGECEDRAITHLHDHGHHFFHDHHHTHRPEDTSTVHMIFKDPVRDWFGVILMGLLIVVGYFEWLPGHLSTGMLVCAAVLGIFPLLKSAFFDSVAKRRVSFALILGICLLLGLLWGKFLEVALISLFLLVGSFMRLTFSWRND